jgi:hypothetical protein
MEKRNIGKNCNTEGKKIAKTNQSVSEMYLPTDLVDLYYYPIIECTVVENSDPVICGQEGLGNLHCHVIQIMGFVTLKCNISIYQYIHVYQGHTWAQKGRGPQGH